MAYKMKYNNGAFTASSLRTILYRILCQCPAVRCQNLRSLQNQLIIPYPRWNFSSSKQLYFCQEVTLALWGRNGFRTMLFIRKGNDVAILLSNVISLASKLGLLTSNLQNKGGPPNNRRPTGYTSICHY